MSRIIRKLKSDIKLIIYLFRYKILKQAPLTWDNTNNFGDALNPYIFKFLLKQKVFFCDYNLKNKSILGIGSILHKTHEKSIVFGSGFISQTSVNKYPPKSILALRGPKSKEKLNLPKDTNIIFGDPGILVSKIWKKSKIDKNYKLGIIPHYVDEDDILTNNFIEKNKGDVLKINVRNDIGIIIDQITSCENIMSSSLHGLICAESYKIPVIRLIVSEKIIGGDFKFDDYRLGIKAPLFNKITSLELQDLELSDILIKCNCFSVEKNQEQLIDLANRINLKI